MSRTPRIIVVLGLSCGLAFSSIGCQSKAGTGAVAGGVGGAVIGGVIGNNRGSGNTASGAAIGGVIGAVGGGLVGHSMDKADERKAQEQRQREEAERRQQQQYNNYNTRPAPAPATSTITRGDIVDWTRQGIKDEIIIDRIQRSGQQFIITAADESELKSLGVSATVIGAIKNTSKQAGSY